MVVDDEEVLVFVMRRSLERLGYRCSGFVEPLAALEAFLAAPTDYDAVITDLTMPVMTGLELARALKRIRPDVPIGLASGYATPDGADDPAIALTIKKPSSFAELGEALRALLHAGR